MARRGSGPFPQWPDVWRSLKEDSPFRSIPILIFFTVWMTCVAVVLSFSILGLLIKGIWSVIYPWSAFYEEKRQIKRRDRTFTEDIVRRVDPAAPSHLTLGSADTAPQRPEPTDLFFGRLPYEIRREILLLAFGGRTLHMDLDFRAAFPEDPTDASHAGINTNLLDRHHREPGREKAWKWFGCVCHRTAPPYEDGPAGALSHGRMRSWPLKGQRKNADKCLRGMGRCALWPGQKPDKCQIGIGGWLRTCSQAYFEGMRILYGENTINISSPHLLRGLQDIMSANVMSSVASLELSWYPNEVPLKQGFVGYSDSGGSSPMSPLFPNLAHLRLCIAGVDERAADEPKPSFLGPEHLGGGRMTWYATHMLPRFDSLVEKLAPPTAQVYIWCGDWEWYKAVDTILLKGQGKETTQPRLSQDYRGLECWRQMPNKQGPNKQGEGASADETQGELGQSRWTSKPRGYWIHVVHSALSRKRFNKSDEEHYHLYNVGAHPEEGYPCWTTVPHPAHLP